MLLLAVGAVPSAVFAQRQPVKDARIGFLYAGVSEALALRVNAFVEGVRGTERRHIELVSRVAEGDPARLPALASDIVAQKIDVLFAAGPAAVRAAHAVAAKLPVVALDLETDPVESGLVASLSHPGGRSDIPGLLPRSRERNSSMVRYQQRGVNRYASANSLPS